MENENINLNETPADAKPVLADSGGYFKEKGKTWYQTSGRSIFRVHDDNFSGMRFEHKRCPFCNRITSIHTLHWLTHMDKCASEKYTWEQLIELQHRTPDEIEKTGYGFIGRE